MAIGRLCTILAVFIVPGFCLPGMKAQNSSKPLRIEDVLELPSGGVPSKRVAAMLREQGISLKLTQFSAHLDVPPDPAGQDKPKRKSVHRARTSTRRKPGIIYMPVLHDHGSSRGGHCIGFMAIGNGMIQYRSTNKKHVFRFPLKDVKEVKKNEAYLAEFGAFHISLVNGADYNFVALTLYGQFESPDSILTAIHRAMGKD